MQNKMKIYYKQKRREKTEKKSNEIKRSESVNLFKSTYAEKLILLNTK